MVFPRIVFPICSVVIPAYLFCFAFAFSQAFNCVTGDLHEMFKNNPNLSQYWAPRQTADDKENRCFFPALSSGALAADSATFVWWFSVKWCKGGSVVTEHWHFLSQSNARILACPSAKSALQTLEGCCAFGLLFELAVKCALQSHVFPPLGGTVFEGRGRLFGAARGKLDESVRRTPPGEEEDEPTVQLSLDDDDAEKATQRRRSREEEDMQKAINASLQDQVRRRGWSRE